MKSKKVAILAYPKLCTFEFGCAIELFALPRADIKNWYQCDIVSLKKNKITATGGFQVRSDIIFSPTLGFSAYDMVVIAGWTGVNTDIPESLITALQVFHRKGGTIISFCSGAFVIASTGLLDGKEATTHWRYEEAFKKRFPRVNYCENVLYSMINRLYTSAGSASALDLGIAIIREDYGASIANSIARRLVISPHREGGQFQFSENPKIMGRNHLDNSLKWANDNLQYSININQMAEQACLSRRSFDRHFRLKLRSSPKEWLIKQRVYLAREFLESSHLSIEQIADKSGFGTAMNLRHHFAKILGISPSYYRKQFLQITDAKKPE